MTAEQWQHLMKDKPDRYYKGCAIARESGFELVWSAKVPTGRISCWVRYTVVLIIQQLDDGVEIYTNQETPRDFAGIAEWLNPC